MVSFNFPLWKGIYKLNRVYVYTVVFDCRKYTASHRLNVVADNPIEFYYILSARGLEYMGRLVCL